MARSSLPALLLSVRDHLTVAIHNMERGETERAAAELEKASMELREATSPEGDEGLDPE